MGTLLNIHNIYKKMGSFSTPGEGIHSLRVFDVAIIDVLLTILAAIAISKRHFAVVFTILIILSILVHTLLGIKTRTNAWLFSKQ